MTIYSIFEKSVFTFCGLLHSIKTFILRVETSSFEMNPSLLLYYFFLQNYNSFDIQCPNINSWMRRTRIFKTVQFVENKTKYLPSLYVVWNRFDQYYWKILCLRKKRYTDIYRKNLPFLDSRFLFKLTTVLLNRKTDLHISRTRKNSPESIRTLWSVIINFRSRCDD